MKILTIVGTRPELIRLSRIISKLDMVCAHTLVFTNQNYDANLSTLFLKELRIRTPDYVFGRTDSLGQFFSAGFARFEAVLDEVFPDKILVLGDTNSGLLSVLAAKRGIPVYHMEAGNRCYDSKVPEETNRKIIDSFSSFNLPYTANSKENLIREGHSKNTVFQIGNPINEVLQYYKKEIDNSSILDRLALYTGFEHITYDRPFILLSFHRTENVDDKTTAKKVMEALAYIAKEDKIKIVFPCHPRTRDQFEKHGLVLSENIMCIDPIGFFDFVRLEQSAQVVFTDSGTVPEETALFGRPCIVLRQTTERQELTELGSLILSGTDKYNIIQAYRSIDKLNQSWSVPEEYTKTNVSDTVIRILMSHS